MKACLAAASPIDVAHLPYHRALLEWLREEQRSGRTLVLASASNGKLVALVAAHLGIFDSYVASTAELNLKGQVKLDQLRTRFPGGFDYCGDSGADAVIWGSAEHAIAVGNSAAVRELKRTGRCSRHFESRRSVSSWIKACRPLHWVKNLLVFVPVVTGHDLHVTPLKRSILMFWAFSFCASGVYLLNDVLDLESDRRHEKKRERPLASGRMPISAGLFLAPLLVGAAILAAGLLGQPAIVVLGLYFVATTAYSVYFKRVLLADVIGLSLLYLARIGAGHVVTGIALSPWQLSFALLMFVSLAFGKRASELQRLNTANRSEVPGRGYRAMDIGAVRSMGVATGVSAVVVFCLYLNSETAYLLYRQWELLWLLVPALLYWITRFWILTERGVVMEDPIVFVARDRATYLVAVFSAIIMFLATRNLFPHLPIVR